MPRYARRKSTSSIYHIMLRGNERREIFLDDDDKVRFLDTLQRMRENSNYEIYAYCLMSNHIHLLIKEGKDSIPRSMKRVCVSYVYYFNKKYQRVGHLFQDRYRSEEVENDSYILAAARYIHNNPVKAGMVEKAEDYKWSSYRCYIEGDTCKGDLIDRGFLLSMLDSREDRAMDRLREFTGEKIEDKFIEYVESGTEIRVKEVSLKNLESETIKVLNKYGYNLESIKGCKDKKLRNQIIREIKDDSGASVRELSRILGMSKDVIFRA